MGDCKLIGVINFFQRKNTMKFLYASCATFLLLATPINAANASKSELEKAIVGNKVFFQTKSGFKGTALYTKNGDAHLIDSNFKIKKDRGVWRFIGNRFCVKWKKIRNGVEKCGGYRKIKSNKFKRDDGLVLTVIE